LNELEAEKLLAYELAYLHLQLRESKIPGAGKGVFTTEPLGAGDHIGFFYGHLIYDNVGIGAEKDSLENIGEGVLAVPVKEFSKWSADLPYKASINNSTEAGDQTDVWVYPVPFCAMRYINDPRVLQATATENNNPPPPQPEKCNVKWKVVDKQPTNVGFQDPSIISIVAINNIAPGSELYLDYGNAFNRFD
jgi:hypothetical protein